MMLFFRQTIKILIFGEDAETQDRVPLQVGEFRFTGITIGGLFIGSIKPVNETIFGTETKNTTMTFGDVEDEDASDRDKGNIQ